MDLKRRRIASRGPGTAFGGNEVYKVVSVTPLMELSALSRDCSSSSSLSNTDSDLDVKGTFFTILRNRSAASLTNSGSLMAYSDRITPLKGLSRLSTKFSNSSSN